jgi:opacity protein-like surface antigen
MKKILLLLFFCSASALSAQFQIGLNAGVAFNGTGNDNDSYYGYENYTSFYPEIKVGYAFTSHWSLNLGMGISSKGYEQVSSEILGGTHEYYKFRYFSLPFCISYSYPVNAVYGKISLGIQPNFYNRQNVPAGKEIDYQQMKHTVGGILGVEAGYFLTDNLSIHLSYRYNPDWIYADEEKIAGKLSSNYVLLGITYSVAKRKNLTEEPEHHVIPDPPAPYLY